MLIEQKQRPAKVSRRDAEAKLVECRNKFLGFLRKRLRNPQDAEDVFQDFCLKVLRNHASIKNGERLDAWLGITLRHTLTDHYRRQATRKAWADAYANEAKLTEPETEGVDDTVCSCISVALKELEPAQIELLTRLDLQEEPRIAIAADLAVSQNTLRVRVHRARAELKKRITEICPLCGAGKFMQCGSDHSLKGSLGNRIPA